MMHLFHCLLDWEAFKKPLSRRFSNEVIRDIRYADPVKWKHPIVAKTSARYQDPKGRYGYIKRVNGKDIPDEDRPFEDIYVYEHPDLTYRIEHYPTWTCRDGYGDHITAKDARRIQHAFYRMLDKR